MQSNGRVIRCADVAALVESMESIPEARRAAQVAAWRGYAAQVDVGLLQMIQRAQNTLNAGISSAELYRECGSY